MVNFVLHVITIIISFYIGMYVCKVNIFRYYSNKKPFKIGGENYVVIKETDNYRKQYYLSKKSIEEIEKENEEFIDKLWE